MRLTLTSLSSQYIHMPLAPWCLRTAVEAVLPGVQVTVCDLNVNQQPEELLRRIVETRPDAVGFSVYIWNREATVRLIRRLKALAPSLLVVTGGPEASFDAADFLTASGCDLLLRGAGEVSLPLLLHRIMERKPLDGVPGLCRMMSGETQLSDPADPPPPTDAVYDDVWLRALNGRMASCETSRGCRFS